MEKMQELKVTLFKNPFPHSIIESFYDEEELKCDSGLFPKYDEDEDY